MSNFVFHKDLHRRTPGVPDSTNLNSSLRTFNLWPMYKSQSSERCMGSSIGSIPLRYTLFRSPSDGCGSKNINFRHLVYENIYENDQKSIFYGFQRMLLSPMMSTIREISMIMTQVDLTALFEHFQKHISSY